MPKSRWIQIEKNFWLHEYEGKRGRTKKYYMIFTDWQRRHRKFPLSENEQQSRDRWGELRRLNNARFDFDAEEREREVEAKRKQEAERKSVTLGQFAERYFETIAPTLDKRPRTLKREEEHWNRRTGDRRMPSPLQDHFGPMALCDIKLTAIASYRVKREKQVSFVSTNRELSFLRYLLNLAEEEGILEAAPRIRLRNEQSRVRTRTLTPEEYCAIISHMRRKQQRYYACLYEAAMRLREPLKLTWGKTDFKAGLIRLKASDVKEKTDRRSVITWELRKILQELQREQTKVFGIPKKNDLVFRHNNGKPMLDVRDAWLRAVASCVKDGILDDDDVRPHDLRRTAITRWTTLGVPRDIVMECSGHKRGSVHDGYLNFSDEQLVAAFESAGLMSAPKAKPTKAKAV